MVAAMHIQTENDKTAFGLRTTDLRNIAIGLTAAIVLIMVAGQMADSGSASASTLDDTAEKRFVPPNAVTTPTSTGNEDAAYSSTIIWTDQDGTDVVLSCTAGCSGWITFTDGGNSVDTATLTGTPLDAHVGANAITIQGVSGGDTVQASYTITITNVNDEPTLSADTTTPTFTEDGSNVVLYDNAAVADSESQSADTWLSITITITNVVDTTEYLVIDGSDCDITAAATCVANTADNAGAAVVTMDSTTATVVWTADAGTIDDTEMQTLIDTIAYKNTDQSPTTGSTRVITITTLQDEGGVVGSGDDSVTVSIASTVTVAAAADLPTSAAVTVANAEDTQKTYAAGNFAFTDVDGDSIARIQITTLESSGDLEC